jgi:hypothetical protein
VHHGPVAAGDCVGCHGGHHGGGLHVGQTVTVQLPGPMIGQNRVIVDGLFRVPVMQLTAIIVSEKTQRVTLYGQRQITERDTKSASRALPQKIQFVTIMPFVSTTKSPRFTP